MQMLSLQKAIYLSISFTIFIFVFLNLFRSTKLQKNQYKQLNKNKQTMDQKQKCYQFKNIISRKITRAVLSALFFIFATLYILSGQLQIQEFRIFKAFPLCILIMLVLPSNFNRFSALIILGLSLGMGGDLILQYYGHQGFMFFVGTGLFLVGHIIYNFCMQQICFGIQKINLLSSKTILYSGSCLFLSASSINLSTTTSEKMKQQALLTVLLPAYLVILTINVVLGFLLALASSFKNKSFICLFIGTLSFCISDNTLGRTIFSGFKIFGNKKINRIVIMVTYYLGQFLIGVALNWSRNYFLLCHKNSQIKDEEQPKRVIQYD